jgi:hypothetical protein
VFLKEIPVFQKVLFPTILAEKTEYTDKGKLAIMI